MSDWDLGCLEGLKFREEIFKGKEILSGIRDDDYY